MVKRPVVEMPEYDINTYTEKYPRAFPLQAPAQGKLIWEIDVQDSSKAPVAGTKVQAGEPCAYVQTRYGLEPVLPASDGRIVAVTAPQGKNVVKGEIVAFAE